MHQLKVAGRDLTEILAAAGKHRVTALSMQKRISEGDLPPNLMPKSIPFAEDPKEEHGRWLQLDAEAWLQRTKLSMKMLMEKAEREQARAITLMERTTKFLREAYVTPFGRDKLSKQWDEVQTDDITTSEHRPEGKGGRKM